MFKLRGRMIISCYRDLGLSAPITVSSNSFNNNFASSCSFSAAKSRLMIDWLALTPIHDSTSSLCRIRFARSFHSCPASHESRTHENDHLRSQFSHSAYPGLNDEYPQSPTCTSPSQQGQLEICNSSTPLDGRVSFFIKHDNN